MDRDLPLELAPELAALSGAMPSIVTGELIAIADEGRTPLVLYPGQPGTAAVPARSLVDLHGAHLGQPVMLLIDGPDGGSPIVMGVIRQGMGAAPELLSHVEIDVDGRRVVIQAKEQLVLRCGKASITLTRAGAVMLEGSHVLSRSTGVNRIQGGSVQLN